MEAVGTLGNVNNVNIGGGTSFKSSNIMLIADMKGNELVSTFRNGNVASAAGYTPSGLNKFYATGIIIQATNGSNDPDVRLGYGSSDAGWNSGTLPSNAMGIAYGAVTNIVTDPPLMYNFSPAVTATAGADISKIPILIAFPNGQYPFVVWNANISAGGGVIMFGYEAP